MNESSGARRSSPERPPSPPESTPRYLLQHEHRPEECGAAFASFNGHDSPLRHMTTMASCLYGGHVIWWQVQAPSEAAALQLLPFYVAQRTTVVAIAPVEIP